MHDADKMPTQQSANFSTNTKTVRRQAFLQYSTFIGSLYPKCHNCLPVHLTRKVHSRIPSLYYVVHLQSVINIFQEIFFFEEMLKSTFCCSHFFSKCLISLGFSPESRRDLTALTCLWFQLKPTCYYKPQVAYG